MLMCVCASDSCLPCCAVCASISKNRCSACSRDALLHSYTETRSAFPDLHVSLLDVVSDRRSRVTVRWCARGTFTGPLGTLAPTRAPVCYSGLWLGTFDAKNRLVRGHGAWDTRSFLEQLGVRDTRFDPVSQANCPKSKITALTKSIVVHFVTSFLLWNIILLWNMNVILCIIVFFSF